MIANKLKDKPKLPSTSKVESSQTALWGHQAPPVSEVIWGFSLSGNPTAPPQQGESRRYSQQWLGLGIVVCKICIPPWQETMKLQNSEDVLFMTKGKPRSYTMDRKLNCYSQIICCFFLSFLIWKKCCTSVCLSGLPSDHCEAWGSTRTKGHRHGSHSSDLVIWQRSFQNKSLLH